MQRPAAGDQCVVSLEEGWVVTVQEKVDATAAETRRSPTIFRVPAHLRNQDSDAYEPEIISFGPYHHGKEKLKMMEKQKWRSLGKFLTRDPSKDLRYYLSLMKALEKRARDCYSEDITTMDSSKEFAQMLLLDGSFLVEFLLSDFGAENFPINSTASVLVGRLYRDVVKLENQVPYFILEELCQSLDQRPLLAHQLIKFFKLYIEIPRPIGCSKRGMFDHVLHFYHYWVCATVTQEIGTTKKPSHLGLIIKMVCSPLSFILILFSKKPELKTIWNAKDLDDAGVKFSPNLGTSENFLNLSFSDGVLHMTPIHLYDDSNSIFRNLVSMEQCDPGGYGLRITNFNFFMQYLVRSPEDLMVLQKAGVLISHLSSEEKAVHFFSSICKEVFHSSNNSFFKLTSEELNKYCNSKWPRWRAMLKRDYFSNPWGYLSVLAAVTLLILTITQATVAVLSYNQQLKSGSNSIGKP